MSFHLLIALGWMLLGALAGLALLGVGIWIQRRWQATTDVFTLGYTSTSRHGLALTTERSAMPAIATRRFYGAQEIGVDVQRLRDLRTYEEAERVMHTVRAVKFRSLSGSPASHERTR